MTTITLNAATIISAIAFMGSLGSAGAWLYNSFDKLNRSFETIEENVAHLEEADKRVRALECYLEVVRCDGVFSGNGPVPVVATAPAPQPSMTLSAPPPQPVATTRVAAEEPIEERPKPLTLEQKAYNAILDKIPNDLGLNDAETE